MESEKVHDVHDSGDESQSNDANGLTRNNTKEIERQVQADENMQQGAGNSKCRGVVYQIAATTEDGKSGEFNREAFEPSDDVIRAGGFGARDDIGSFLPVASDCTDFEVAILDAKSYEEPQGESCRPGLGWREPTETP